MIKVGFLVSYDYEYLKVSLPLIYPYADTIALAIDDERKSWSGNPFHIPDDFFTWVKEFDQQNKIRIYEDNFHLPELSAIENDGRQRNLLAAFMGEGGWHIQIDSDEYFWDFKEFVALLNSKNHLLKDPKKNPVDIGAFLIPIYKQTESGFLYINNCYETMVLATNYPDYKRARRSDHFVLYTNYCLFHQSWARSPEEIWYKIKNWGHVTDFNTTSYFNLWKATDEYNYNFIKDFHPLTRGLWNELAFGKGATIEEFMTNYRAAHALKIPTGRFLKKKYMQYRRFLGIR